MTRKRVVQLVGNQPEVNHVETYYDGVSEDRIRRTTYDWDAEDKLRLTDFVRALSDCGLAPRSGRLRALSPGTHYYRFNPGYRPEDTYSGASRALRGYRAKALSAELLSQEPLARDRLGAELRALSLAAKPRT